MRARMSAAAATCRSCGLAAQNVSPRAVHSSVRSQRVSRQPDRRVLLPAGKWFNASPDPWALDSEDLLEDHFAELAHQESDEDTLAELEGAGIPMKPALYWLRRKYAKIYPTAQDLLAILERYELCPPPKRKHVTFSDTSGVRQINETLGGLGLEQRAPTKTNDSHAVIELPSSRQGPKWRQGDNLRKRLDREPEPEPEPPAPPPEPPAPPPEPPAPPPEPPAQPPAVVALADVPAPPVQDANADGNGSDDTADPEEVQRQIDEAVAFEQQQMDWQAQQDLDFWNDHMQDQWEQQPDLQDLYEPPKPLDRSRLPPGWTKATDYGRSKGYKPPSGSCAPKAYSIKAAWKTHMEYGGVQGTDEWWTARGLRPSSADAAPGEEGSMQACSILRARKIYEKKHGIEPEQHPEYTHWLITGHLPEHLPLVSQAGSSAAGSSSNSTRKAPAAGTKRKGNGKQKLEGSSSDAPIELDPDADSDVEPQDIGSGALVRVRYLASSAIDRHNNPVLKKLGYSIPHGSAGKGPHKVQQCKFYEGRIASWDGDCINVHYHDGDKEKGVWPCYFEII